MKDVNNLYDGNPGKQKKMKQRTQREIANVEKIKES